MVTILIALAAAAAAPSAEAQGLGRRLAETGLLASLLPLMKEKETEELLQEGADLTDVEKAQLRQTVDRTYSATYNRLMQATGEAYAERLSVQDMRVLVGFFSNPAASRYRAAMPAVMASTMQAIGTIDFKKDVRAQFCARIGKMCGKK